MNLSDITKAKDTKTKIQITLKDINNAIKQAKKQVGLMKVGKTYRLWFFNTSYQSIQYGQFYDYFLAHHKLQIHRIKKALDILFCRTVKIPDIEQYNGFGLSEKDIVMRIVNRIINQPQSCFILCK